MIERSAGWNRGRLGNVISAGFQSVDRSFSRRSRGTLSSSIRDECATLELLAEPRDRITFHDMTTMASHLTDLSSETKSCLDFDRFRGDKMRGGRSVALTASFGLMACL